MYVPLYALNVDLLRTTVWATSFQASVAAILLPLLSPQMLMEIGLGPRLY